MRSRAVLRTRLWETATALGLLSVVVLRLRFFLSDADLTGWDTLGHRHLAEVFFGFLSAGHSRGFDLEWFQGFPAFYFYPPLYYFLVSIAAFALNATDPTYFARVFNASLLVSVLTLVLALYRLLRLFLPRVRRLDSILLGSAGALLYLLYTGESTQGVGLVGHLGGTVVSTLGHALVLLCLASLERTRRNPSRARIVQTTALFSLVPYAHYLSAVFLYLALGAYALCFRRHFPWRVGFSVLVGPVVAAAPVWLPLVLYSAHSTASPYISYYPLFLSLLGTDFLAELHRDGIPGVLRQLVFEMKFLLIGVCSLCAFLFYRALRHGLPSPRDRFALLMAVLFGFLSLDSSLAHLLPLGIHWYRAFELFWIFAVVVSLIAFAFFLAQAPAALRTWGPATLCLVVLLRLFTWSPLQHAGYRSAALFEHGPAAADLQNMIAHMKTLPRALVWPELVRTREFHGSPHALDLVVRRSGHRSAMGLTIESSLTTRLAATYVSRAWPHVFFWGIDPAWNVELFANTTNDRSAPGEALPGYFRRAGVRLVLGRTPTLHNYLSQRPEWFRLQKQFGSVFLYEVVDSQAQLAIGVPRPWAFVQMEPDGARKGSRIQEFLLHANQLRVRGLPGRAPIVDLGGAAALADFREQHWSGLVIFHRGPDLAPSFLVERHFPSHLPTLLVNFRRAGAARANVRYTYTIVPGLPGAPVASDLGSHSSGSLGAEEGSAGPEAVVHKSGGIVEVRVLAPRGTKGEQSCRPTVLRISHFPLWRSDDGSPLYRTDTNHIYACVRPGSVIRFADGFAGIPTVVMALLLLAAMGPSIHRAFLRLRLSV